MVQASQISFRRRSSETKIVLKFLTLLYLFLEIASFAISKMWLILFLFSIQEIFNGRFILTSCQLQSQLWTNAVIVKTHVSALKV